MRTIFLAASIALCAPAFAEGSGSNELTGEIKKQYGPAPSQEEAERAATAFLMSRLRDPDSARISWTPLTLIDFKRTMFSKRVYGYALQGTVNSRNGYGGYTGPRPYTFFFRDGSLVYAATFDENGSETPLIDYRPKS